MKVQEGGKSYDDINITPMLDLAYVLLVIFIIMTTASVQGVKVDLPKASNSTQLTVVKTKVITVSNQGQLFLDTVPVTMTDLQTQLVAAKSVTPDLPVILKGDRAVQYEKIMEVLDMCSKIGLNSIGLATGKSPPS